MSWLMHKGFTSVLMVSLPDRLSVSRDFGWFDSSNSWTVLQGELDPYFSLGSSDWFRQRVIALDFWSAYSPSWQVEADGEITNRPPPYAGAALGALWRRP
jgi:hypothetical protein